MSVHMWVNASEQSGWSQNAGNWTSGYAKVRIDIYDPLNNSVRAIPGASQTETLQLQPGVHFYQASWGQIAQNAIVLKGETVMVTIWSSCTKLNAVLLFNSATYPSNVDFPIVVPENLLAAVGVGSLVFVLVGLLQWRRGKNNGMLARTPESEGYRGIQRIVIVAAAVIFLTLPLVATFNDLLTSLVSASGLSGMVAPLVPYEAAGVSTLLRSIGLQAGSAASQVWIAGGFFPVTAVIDWNCSGWQSFAVLGVTAMVGLREIPRRRDQLLLAAVGIVGTFGVNVLRVFMVVVIACFVGYPAALIFHDYMGTILTLVWIFGFWAIALRHFARTRNASTNT